MKCETKPKKLLHEEIQITIESEDELKYLWHIFNFNNKKVLDMCYPYSSVWHISKDVKSEPVFDVLDGLVTKYGLKKDVSS